MQITLRIDMIVYALFLLITVTHLLKKRRLPEKYSILWYAFAIIILLVGIVPGFLENVSKALGFEVMSNFVIGILIGLLTIMCLALSVMIARQRKRVEDFHPEIVGKEMLHAIEKFLAKEVKR